MEEQLISFETAKIAKDKGFTYAYQFYNASGKLQDFGMVGGWTNCNEKNYAAPTQSFLQKWLREKHQIHIAITSISQESWQYHVTLIGEKLGDRYDEDYVTYEDALEDGLVRALKLI